MHYPAPTPNTHSKNWEIKIQLLKYKLSRYTGLLVKHRKLNPHSYPYSQKPTKMGELRLFFKGENM